MDLTLVLPAFIFALCGSQVFAEDSWSTRSWQSNINYNNSRNWNIGRVPCDTDRVVFQSSESVVLELPEGKTSIRGLVLPSHIEILLPRDGVFQFTGKKFSSTCNGKDAVFKQTQASRWTDSANWDGWTPATPDLERVPCVSDAVHFPPGATYRVILPDTVRIGRLEINGVSMDSVDWFEFCTDGGDRQFFKNNDDIADMEITEQPCPASQWCECDNDYLHPLICKAACPLPLCKQPVQPAGFCCPICGAYFLLGSKSQGKSKLTEHINSFVKDKEVVWHASRVKEFVQVVLVEEGEYSGEVPVIAKELKTSIVESGMGWTAEEFHTSGHVWYPTTFSQVVGHFFSLMVFVVLIIAAIIVFYSHNWSWLHFSPVEGRPFVFARFENQSGEVVVASEQRQSAPVPPQAFDNPMYGATGQEQRNTTVENLEYTELEEAPSTSGLVEGMVALHSTNFSVGK